LPGVLGFAAALEAGDIGSWPTSYPDRYDFKDLLARNGTVLRPGVQCSHVIAVASERISAAAMVIKLDAMGFAVSAGSACSSGTLPPRRALAASGMAPPMAARAGRGSPGWTTSVSGLAACAVGWAGATRE